MNMEAKGSHSKQKKKFQTSSSEDVTSQHLCRGSDITIHRISKCVLVHLLHLIVILIILPSKSDLGFSMMLNVQYAYACKMKS